MWKYIKKYMPLAIIAALLMVGEVTMDLLQPDLMSEIVDDGVLGMNNGGVGDMSVILRVGLEMIVLVLIGGVCGSLNNVFVHMTAQSTGNLIRKDAFRRIMSFSFPQEDRFGTGSLITRVTNDITQIQMLIGVFIRGMIRTAFMAGGSLIFLFMINVRFALIVLCAIPIVVLTMVICMYKAYPLLPKLQAKLDRINAILQEDISGIRVIKACVREIYEKARFGKANGELIKTQLTVLVVFAFMNPISNMVMNTVVILILWSGFNQVAVGMTSPGVIIAAITYTTQLLSGILSLVMLFQNITRGMASWRRVKEVLNTEPELKDGTMEGETETHGKIEFRNVSFAFPGSEQTVLHDISLTIEPGETVAIMGATGCGKTAMVSLIPRFYDASQGTILVDDVDVRDYSQKALREKVSIALQKSELFTTSIKGNIAWGCPAASDDQIREAARIAQAEDFISAAPEGFDTLVAERGMSLSGGQKQRVSIARAVLKPAEILIFDDSTSALDLKTEADLYDALRESRPESTKIFIAQRIASVRRADRIVVLSEGGIEACGSHQELMASCRTYQDIYYSQIGEEENYG